MTPDVSSEATPTVLNLLFCDGVHRDPGSGKWTLLGLFNSINARDFPVVHPQLFAYLALFKMSGKQSLRLQIVHADNKQEVFYKIDAQLSVPDPQTIADLVVPIQKVSFHKAGEHFLQVFINNQYIAERPFYIHKLPAQT